MFRKDGWTPEDRRIYYVLAYDGDEPTGPGEETLPGVPEVPRQDR